MVDLSPAMEPTRHKLAYIQDCRRQLEELRTNMNVHKDGVDERIETLENDIREHLWVMDGFIEPASQGLEKARADVESLLERLAAVIGGYHELPREEAGPGLTGGGFS